MAKKTVEFELPDLNDTTLIYLIAGVILITQISTAYFTLQVNQNLETLSAAISGLEIEAPSDVPSQEQNQPQIEVVDVSEDDDDPRGSPSAKVKIIMFSDYQCPYCARGEESIAQVRQTYGDDVVIYFRDFPLSSFHQFAQKAAEAAECAGEQGKYWEMHDKLFDNQSELTIGDLKQYAIDLGLDSTAFDSCLDNGDMEAEVLKDFSDGQAAGVSGTPTFFINGKKLVGAQPFSAFKALIDAELA